jgi:G:T-mismatch repair DNA endonuclease (very short patch repair protein)
MVVAEQYYELPQYPKVGGYVQTLEQHILCCMMGVLYHIHGGSTSNISPDVVVLMCKMSIFPMPCYWRCSQL